MFKKLLTNLPFNPSLLGQVSFYSSRLKKEKFVRGAGLFCLALALVIQTLSVVTPPQSTLARSPNDIIYGGFSSREQAVRHCLDQTKDVHKIFQYYRITCDSLANAQTVTIKSTDHSGKLHSLGRVPQPAKNPKNGKPSGQYNVNIPGVEQLYMKNLWYWDTYSHSSYKVLKMTNQDGTTMYILYDCGNIVTVGKYTPPPPPKAPAPTPVPEKPVEIPDACPNLPGNQTKQSECYPCPEAKTDTSKTACMVFTKKASNRTAKITNANKTFANPSDILVYKLTAKNTGNIEFKDFIFNENLADVLEYSDIYDAGNGVLNSKNHLIWPSKNIAPNSIIEVQFSVKVKDVIPNTPRSSSDPGSHDLCMTNVFYDESVNICLKPPVHKQIEEVATTLPNTGPGESMAIGFVIVTLMGYFFARNKTMVDELDIVRKDFTSGGN